MKVDIQSIKPMYELNARMERSYKDEHFEALKESIRMSGLIEPLVVYPDGDMYILIAGYRRYTAISQLKSEGLIDWADVDVAIDNTVQSVEGIGRAVLYRQLQNKSFTLSEKSRAFANLAKEMSLKEISRELGESASFIETLVMCSDMLAHNSDLAQMADDKEIGLTNLKYAARMWHEYPENREALVEATYSFGSMPHASYAMMIEKVLPEYHTPAKTFDEYAVNLRDARLSPTMKNRLEAIGRKNRSDTFDYLKGKLRSEEEILQILSMDESTCPDEVSYVIQMLFHDLD